MSVVDQGVSGARGGTVDRLVTLLRDGIVNHRYAPGQRLIEADLTRDMGVSRAPCAKPSDGSPPRACSTWSPIAAQWCAVCRSAR